MNKTTWWWDSLGGLFGLFILVQYGSFSSKTQTQGFSMFLKMRSGWSRFSVDFHLPAVEVGQYAGPALLYFTLRHTVTLSCAPALITNCQHSPLYSSKWLWINCITALSGCDAVFVFLPACFSLSEASPNNEKGKYSEIVARKLGSRQCRQLNWSESFCPIASTDQLPPSVLEKFSLAINWCWDSPLLEPSATNNFLLSSDAMCLTVTMPLSKQCSAGEFEAHLYLQQVNSGYKLIYLGKSLMSTSTSEHAFQQVRVRI